MESTKDIGNRSETLACDWLQGKGYRIIARNYRQIFGEIDIIAQKGSTLTAVEVKTIPENWNSDEINLMVNPFKLAKIKRVLSAFIANREGLFYDEISFDVISVTRSGRLMHYQGVV